MADTATISHSEYDELLKRMHTLEQLMRDLIGKLKTPAEPVYGSAAWWEKEEAEATEDIKHGRVYGPFENVDDLFTSLHEEAEKP